MDNKYKVQLVFSHPSGGLADREEGLVKIEIMDEDSRSFHIEVQCTYEQFARALMHQVVTGVDAEIEHPERLGTVREFKTELVPFKCTYFSTKEEDKAALKPFEVDGWIGSREGLHNNHKSVEKDGIKYQAVNFERWVRKNG